MMHMLCKEEMIKKTIARAQVNAATEFNYLEEIAWPKPIVQKYVLIKVVHALLKIFYFRPRV